MAYNHEYPYTDPSRYNDDWLIHQVKAIGARLDSYEELAKELEKELKYIKELDRRVTNLEQTIKLLDTIQADIKTLKVNYKKLSENVTAIQLALDGIDTRFKSVYAYIDSMAKQLDIKLNNRIYDIRQELYIFNAQLNAQIDALRAYIEEVERKSSASVYNPVIGSRVTLDVNNNEIYSYMRYGGMTAAQLMERGYTENELKSYNLTARDFGYFGKKYLKQLFVYSPVSGARMPIEQALSDVLTQVCNTLTESERETMNLTEDELAALDLTAIQWLTYRP